MGLYVEHIACTSPTCTSSDGMAVYEEDDGTHNATCFVCKTYDPDPYSGGKMTTNITQGVTHKKRLSIKEIQQLIKEIQQLPSLAIPNRALSQRAVERYGVKVEISDSSKEIIAWYYPRFKQNTFTGYKKKFFKAGGKKTYTSIGDNKESDLFGMQLFGDSGKFIIITEGEEDALAACDMLWEKGKNYRVVSLPDGANDSAVRRNLELLERYETVILCFDQDQPGEDAALSVANLLTPGKAKTMHFSENDANAMLLAGKTNEFFASIYNAQEHRPDGISSVADLYEEAIKPVEWGLPWPWPKLTEMTYGRRRREMYGFGAGTGCGKTEGFKEVIDHVMWEDKLPVGLVFLEEHPAHTLNVLAGKHANKRFHIPDSGWTQEERENGILALSDKAYFYNHWGQKDWETVRSKIRWMVVVLGIKDVFLDHLTALVAGENDVNSALARIMEDMAALTQELDFTLYYISHLSTPSGTPHEEGGRVTVSQFRGSRTIGFWSHFLFGYERNQQAEDETTRNTTTFRVLKDRYTGLATGATFKLVYNHETGRMLEEEVIDEF